jgi:hypothetical protein
MNKLLIYSLTIATIAWSLSFSFILPVEAANINNGDVIKLANDPAVYYVVDGKKVLMVNRAVYSSWSNIMGDAENNFSNLKTVSQADFDDLPFGSNATVRPGTGLIKFNDSNDLFAVGLNSKLYKLADNNTKNKLYPTDAIYVLTNSFRSNYYNYGNPVAVLDVNSDYPDGTFLRKSDDFLNYYIIIDGKINPFSDLLLNKVRNQWVKLVDGLEKYPLNLGVSEPGIRNAWSFFEKMECTDSDLGSKLYPHLSGKSDPLRKGTTIGYINGIKTTKEDYCYSPVSLVEYYCGFNGQLLKIGIPCQTTCVDGACIPTEGPIEMGQSVDNKKVAWEIFQKYLSYMRDNNIEGLRSIMYLGGGKSINDFENITEQEKEDYFNSYGKNLEEELKKLMTWSADQSSYLKETDFVNLVEDEKQLIMSTNLINDSHDDVFSYKKEKIFFVKGSSGDLKILTVRTSTYGDATDKTETEKWSSLQEKVKDSDGDGLTDTEETCEEFFSSFDDDCVKTDSYKRDTNGNGWWDSVDRILKDY